MNTDNIVFICGALGCLYLAWFFSEEAAQNSKNGLFLLGFFNVILAFGLVFSAVLVALLWWAS